MRLIDANVLVDGLVDQGTTTHSASFELLTRIHAGNELVAITGPVIAECVYILRTARGGRKTAAEISRSLREFLESDGLELPDRNTWIRAMELMAAYNIDFPDAHMA